MNVLRDGSKRKGFMDMRKVGKVPTYNKPLATSYLYPFLGQEGNTSRKRIRSIIMVI